MSQAQRFPTVPLGPPGSFPDAAPLLPVSLATPHATIQAMALLDSGAAVNVLPYDLGVQLGFNWPQQQRYALRLTGNLANFAACGVAVDLTVGTFPAVRQFFAWTQAAGVPLLLGRTNFFSEFDVCFFLARSCFDVQPRQ